jgi:hypothetical protein
MLEVNQEVSLESGFDNYSRRTLFDKDKKTLFSARN